MVKSPTYGCQPNMSQQRRGFTVQELIVSVAVLLTVMTITTSMLVNVNKIWKDIRSHRIAVCELGNQLERLTRMTKDEVESELEKLTASPICANSLREPDLTGTLAEDDLGYRVTLTIQYKNRFPGKQLSLSAWLNPSIANEESKESP